MATKKKDAAEALQKVTEAIETSASPEPQTEAELNARFNHIPAPGTEKPVFPTPQ